MLAFALSNENRTIQIYCDSAGIDALISELLAIKASQSHTHLRPPMDERDTFSILSKTTPWGDPAICEVVIDHYGD